MALVGYLGVLYAFMADIFVFHETIAPMAYVGAVCIFMVTVWVSVLKIRQTQKEAALKKEAEVELAETTA